MSEAASLPPLSDAQQEIMEILWAHGEATANEVRERLPRTLNRNTVCTLLVRMEEKGWIKHRVAGRAHIYAPAVAREASMVRKVFEVVDTVCGGSPETLVAALIDHGSFTSEELDRIRKLIDRAKQRKKPQRGR